MDYGEALEWDLFHLWSYDINNPDLTPRRLWNFFVRLPDTSETMQDIAGIEREARNWSPELWMLANVVDSLQAVDWHIIAANSKNKPAPPKPFPRPSLKKKEKKALWPGKTIYTPKES